jgi:hypothetical protein
MFITLVSARLASPKMPACISHDDGCHLKCADVIKSYKLVFYTLRKYSDTSANE